jgi:hypothetical protein
MVGPSTPPKQDGPIHVAIGRIIEAEAPFSPAILDEPAL